MTKLEAIAFISALVTLRETATDETEKLGCLILIITFGNLAYMDGQN